MSPGPPPLHSWFVPQSSNAHTESQSGTSQLFHSRGGVKGGWGSVQRENGE